MADMHKDTHDCDEPLFSVNYIDIHFPMVKGKKKTKIKIPANTAMPFRSDSRHVYLLKRVMREATAEAIRVNKALDIPITYLKGDIIIREFNDGRVEILGPLNKHSEPTDTSHLKKGVVIDLTK